MGGPCMQYVRPPHGDFVQRPCPPCTDNFQVVPSGFEYGGITWHSVEQAFQSLKFPIGSVTQVKIERRAPRPNESDSEYSCKTWEMGQSRGGGKMRKDWEVVKVKVMSVLNIAKYASSVDYRFDLIETGTNRILGQPSTWNWSYWNAAIQTYIRTELHKGTDLQDLLEVIDDMEPAQVETLLSECYDFRAKPESFRRFTTGDFNLGQQMHDADPPPQVTPMESTNQRIPVFNGHLVLADVDDFEDTFNQHLPDMVISMSSKPPAFPEVAHQGEWLFRNFGGYDLLNMDAMGAIANEAINALQEGKTVLIHCLHGQDRTGIIGAALLYAGHERDMDYYLDSIMIRARPIRAEYWFGLNGRMNNQYQHTAHLLSLHLKSARKSRK